MTLGMSLAAGGTLSLFLWYLNELIPPGTLCISTDEMED